MSLIVVSTRQHRLVIFLGLAFALSWWAWPLYVLDLSPTPFFACGPLVAALVVIAMTEGWSGYRTLGARMIHWLVGWRWWVVGLGIPLAVLVVAALANIAIWDAPTPVLADLAWPTLALVFAVRFINPLDGPLGEEPGWRGYALPQLQTGRAPLGAAFILGLLVALWHVPLVMTGQLAETQHPNGQLPQLPLSARYRAARSAVWDCSS
jgi:membrane protease YdiL (CAAX protease family)